MNRNPSTSPPHTSSTQATSTAPISCAPFSPLTPKPSSKPTLPHPLLTLISCSPAYKGIALATPIAERVADLSPEKYGKVCYNLDHKEAKDHGEGGNIVGAPLKEKRVLIVDDVVTAGRAKRKAIAKIRAEGGIVASILVALDRIEKLPAPNGEDSTLMPSAIGEIRKEYGIPVWSILTLNDINGTEGDWFRG